MEPILRLEKVVKTYQQTTAVDNVSFNVPKGTIFGMLGPNGAGKTSLIRIITTITRADSGNVWVDGEQIGSATSRQIGYMPEERGLYKKMKVGEQLMYLAQLKGLSKSVAKEKIEAWFTKFDIDWWDKKVEELSKGMQQKIQFISTVVHEPKILILDEPFSGLDPINTNLIKDEIYQLKEKGTSIIFSTHRMEQVEEVCEHIVLINKGKNILQGEINEVKNRFKENIFEIKYTGELPQSLAAKDAADDGFEIVAQAKNSLKIKTASELDSNKLLSYLLDNGVQISSFQEILPSLNDIFIQEVGEWVDEV